MKKWNHLAGKRMIALCIAVLLCLGAIPFSALAGSGPLGYSRSGRQLGRSLGASGQDDDVPLPAFFGLGDGLGNDIGSTLTYTVTLQRWKDNAWQPLQNTNIDFTNGNYRVYITWNATTSTPNLKANDYFSLTFPGVVNNTTNQDELGTLTVANGSNGNKTATYTFDNRVEGQTEVEGYIAVSFWFAADSKGEQITWSFIAYGTTHTFTGEGNPTDIGTPWPSNKVEKWSDTGPLGQKDYMVWFPYINVWCEELPGDITVLDTLEGRGQVFSPFITKKNNNVVKETPDETRGLYGDGEYAYVQLWLLDLKGFNEEHYGGAVDLDTGDVTTEMLTMVWRLGSDPYAKTIDPGYVKSFEKGLNENGEEYIELVLHEGAIDGYCLVMMSYSQITEKYPEESYSNSVKAWGTEQLGEASVTEITSVESGAKGKPGSLTVIKLDENLQNTLAGAKFTLEKEGVNTIMGPEEVDADGEVIFDLAVLSGSGGAVPGTYYLQEVVAPDNYKRLEEPVTITIAPVYDQSTGQTNNEITKVEGSYLVSGKGKDLVIKFANESAAKNQIYYANFIKTGGTAYSTGSVPQADDYYAITGGLANAEFEVYTADDIQLSFEEDGGRYVQPEGATTGTYSAVLTDGEGRLSLVLREPGSYYLKEVDGPEGYYSGQNQRVEFTVGQSGETVYYIVNNLPRMVEIRKLGEEDEGLEGAKFHLYDGSVGSPGSRIIDLEDLGDGFYRFVPGLENSSIDLATNQQGEIYIEGLPAGNYYLIEIEAPNGYVRDDTPHPFTLQKGSGCRQ